MKEGKLPAVGSAAEGYSAASNTARLGSGMFETQERPTLIHAEPVIAAAPRSSWHPAYFPIAAARPSGSATLTHSSEWSRNPMTLGILSTNAIDNPL